MEIYDVRGFWVQTGACAVPGPGRGLGTRLGLVVKYL